MAVFIFDSDALEKIATIEGKDYVSFQSDSLGEYSFEAFKKRWETLNKDNPRFAEFRPEFAIDVNGNGTIYGMGGWHRYVVFNSGEIGFIRLMCEVNEHLKLAEKIGFRIV